MTRQYQRLDPVAVRRTVDRLVERIAARFPTRHLAEVARELAALVVEVSERSAADRRRTTTVRSVCRVVVAVIGIVAVVAFVLAVHQAVGDRDTVRSVQWLTILEAGIADLGYAAVAVFFLLSVPDRLTRRRLLALLHRLRSLAHVVDMHQLTKDPERLTGRFQPTAESVEVDLTAAELANYLDYCSELLSLVAKTAALCAEESTDPIVLDTVSEIETMTIGLSRKIWQKIGLLRAA